jgi:hypothetical protein
MGFFDVDWKGLAVPFAYIFVLGAMLYTFSTIYRKRMAGACFSHPYRIYSSFPVANLSIKQPSAPL